MKHVVMFALLACLNLPAVGTVIPLHCLIVGGTEEGVETYPHTVEEVEQMVVGVNLMYAQSAMSFQISSVMVTNCNRFVRVNANDTAQLSSLCSMMMS